MNDRLAADVRYALRVLTRRPQFVLVAVITLALGVAVNVVMFQFTRAAVLDRLPVPDPESLVSLGNTWGGLGYEHSVLSYPEAMDYRAMDEVFSSVATYNWRSYNLVTDDGEPEIVQGAATTSNLLDVLGFAPLHGRFLSPEEEAPGGPQVVVLGHPLFQRRFGGDPAIVGETIQLSGIRYTVVGVLGPEMRYPSTQVELWTPTQLDADDPPSRGWRSWTTVARLQPEVDVDQAAGAVQGHGESLRERFPDSYADATWGWKPSLRGLHDHLVREVRPAVLLLLGAVAVVALVACVNVANLFLARAAERHRELAVRAAIGASRGRIASQLLVESALLAFLAGIVGVVLATVSSRAVLPLLPPELGIEGFRMDSEVVLFVFLLCTLIGVVLGGIATPAALKVSRFTSLRGRGEAVQLARARTALVVAQVAVALVLMVVAGLVTRSLQQLLRVDLGFEPGGVAMAQVALDPGRYETQEERLQFFDGLLDRLRGVPGVSAASLISRMPLSGFSDNSISLRDSPKVDAETIVFPQIRSASDGYFETLRIPLLQGRTIDANDLAEGRRVAVVNNVFADLYYGDDSPLGRRFAFGPGAEAETMEIVGVVGTTREGSLGDDLRAVYYLPFRQRQPSQMTLVVRSEQGADAALASMRAVVRELDPLVPLQEAGPVTGLMADASAGQRAQTILLAAFSGLATLLAAIGLYGVLSYLVQQESRSVGVRLALGARPASVVARMVMRGVRLVGIGLVLGLVLTVFVSKAISAQLFQTSAYDVATYASLSLLLLTVGVVATWIPARRAAGVNPLTVLREE